MKLTGNILREYLAKKFHIAAEQKVEETGWLAGTLHYSAGDAVMPGWVYLADGALPSRITVSRSEDTEDGASPSLPLLIAAGGNFSKLPAGAAVIVLDPAQPGEVLSEISRAFSFYETWEQDLLEVQYRLGTVEEMLSRSLPVFHNPLVVLNDGLLLVTMMSEEEGYGKAGIFMPGRERMDIVNAMIQDAEFSENRSIANAYWGPDYLLGFRTLCWNVIRNGETSYLLSVFEETQSLTEADRDLLEVLGFHIKFVLYYHESNRGRQEENLGKVLRRILEDRTYDYMEASRHLAESGWLEEHRYLCLIYQLTYLDQKSLPVVNICHFMEEQYPYCCSFTYQDEIVNFFDLSLTDLSEEEIQNQLKPFIRDSYLKAGFSRSKEGHMDLRRQFVQARIALDVGSRRSPYQWIHYFDRVVQTYIYEQITRRLPGPMLAHKGILKLMESDKKQGTDYMKTLKVYLDNQQNATQTAKELYIHRSTFLYRMERIMELLESDLKDPEEILYLSLSFRMLRIFEK